MFPLYDDQPTTRFPIVTILLIIANLFVFAYWQLGVGLEQSVALAAFVPAELTGHAATSGALPHLFTAMFMHGGWMHLLGNMWFLWIFGNNIEDACGPFRFLAFYLLCGVVATLAYTVAFPASTTPLVGASGAVSGVLGAYLLKHPKANVTTFVIIVIFIRVMRIPAFVFLLIWIGLQVFSQLSTPSGGAGEGGGIAFLAHIGGFVAGLVLIFAFQRYGQRPSRRPPLADWAR